MNEKRLYKIVQGFEKWDKRIVTQKSKEFPDDIYLREVPAPNPWRSFEREKPENGRNILVVYSFGVWEAHRVEDKIYQHRDKLTLDISELTYWMYTPTPPLVKEEKSLKCERCGKQIEIKENICWDCVVAEVKAVREEQEERDACEKEEFQNYLMKNHPKVIEDFDLERAMELKKEWLASRERKEKV